MRCLSSVQPYRNYLSRVVLLCVAEPLSELVSWITLYPVESSTVSLRTMMRCTPALLHAKHSCGVQVGSRYTLRIPLHHRQQRQQRFVAVMATTQAAAGSGSRLVLWFRNDLRVHDNVIVHEAAQRVRAGKADEVRYSS